jgi:hypothetical protein
MGAPYTGRCNCGQVTARIDGEPIWVRQCWCRQCQKIAAGSATTNALFLTEHVHLSGDLEWTPYEAASGNRVEQGFCPGCGTPVLGRNSSRPNACVVRVGFVEMPHDLAPTSAIWLDDAPEWASVAPGLEIYRRQAPVPPAK